MSNAKLTIEQDVQMDVGKIDAGHRSVIKRGCTIRCQSLKIGNDVTIESGTTISSFRGQRADEIIIGDNCYIGHDVNFSLPMMEIGDFTTIHKRVGMFGEKPGVIGHNCWIGESSILNTCGFLYLGNNVGIGTGSHIWTHVGQGEHLEGCILWGDKPTIMEDDTWLVGGQLTISPGVVIRKKSCILPGSVVTTSTIESHCYAGIPAKDLEGKVKAYRDISFEEKYQLMRKFLEEFTASKQGRRITANTIADDGVFCYNLDGLGIIYLLKKWDSNASVRLVHESDMPRIVVCIENNFPGNDPRTSIFDIRTKRYTKQRTAIEIEFVQFMKGYRARFVPSDRPRIGESLLRQYCPDYSSVTDQHIV
jgi:acetyltransferase-like isoleucine patch superfamily enzyme